MNFKEGQIHWLNALILQKHAHIVSGAYKLREVYHGTKVIKDMRLTEEELLKEEMQAMSQQVQWLNEAAQGLIEDAS